MTCKLPPAPRRRDPCRTDIDIPDDSSIQFAGAVGVGNCNGGPQLSFFARRSNDSQPSPPNLVPLPSDLADSILTCFSNAGFVTVEVVWLLISHTVGSQNTVDPVSVPPAPHPRIYYVYYYYH